jgi:hypothetical protein
MLKKEPIEPSVISDFTDSFEDETIEASNSGFIALNRIAQL